MANKPEDRREMTGIDQTQETGTLEPCILKTPEQMGSGVG